MYYLVYHPIPFKPECLNENREQAEIPNTARI